MSVLVKEEFTVSISGDIVKAIQKRYEKDDYSIMVENFFRLMLPRRKRNKNLMLSARLRGCAVSSGLVGNTDKEIKTMMYQEKHGV
ncbi:MAG: hypothetical protein FWG84_01165 [Bacteroidales bacterium]|nr:hypothetical protein [Bacteroidales bacterium]